MDNTTITPDQSVQPGNPASWAPPLIPGQGMTSLTPDDLANDINDVDVKEHPAKPANAKK